MRTIRNFDFNIVAEGNTSRIYQHITDRGKTFAIISPYRTEYTENENRQRFTKLKQEIRSLGYGYIPFISRWSEQDENGNIIASDEQSLLVPSIPIDTAIEIGGKYEQSSIIVKDNDSCREIATNNFVSWDNKKYSIGDTVRVFNVNSDKPLNIEDAREIFERRRGGPSSLVDRRGNQHPFHLSEVYEVEEARPSYFQNEDRKIRIF